MILPQIQIARAHWILGALFLAIVLDEYLPLVGRGGGAVRSRSLVVPWALIVGAVGVWATVVFADVVHDMLVHFLWGDILFAAGALELARRRGVYERPWLDLVLPTAFLSCGVLFIVHVFIDPSGQGVHWHLAMGLLLIAAGVLDLVRVLRRRITVVPLALVPLAGFALALIAIPVAAASSQLAERRAGRHLRGILGCALLIALLFPASAAAHAVLETSAPGWGASLGTSPQHVRLVYDEGVVPEYARVAVLSPSGRDLAGRPQVSGSVVVVPIRPGSRGSYTVRWRMVASADGHVTQGAFSFGVRAKPLPPVAASGVSVPVAPEVLAWLQFLGVVLAGGTLTFRALVLAPAARITGEHRGRDASAAIWVAAAGAVLALHAGLFGFLVGAYPIVGGGLLNVVNTQIIPIRVGTHLGQAWTLMTFAWLAVLALLVGAWVSARRRELLLASAGGLSLCIGFGISWASHPASRGTLPLTADYVHLLAGALWLGGVAALTILAWVSRSLSRPARDELFRACFLRFSTLAAPVVVVLALAGGYVALRELPTPSSVLTSGYGITLLLKSVVFLGALAVAGYHRRSVVPRITSGAPVASVRRTLTIEVGLLLVAIALAATLSQIAPPR